MEALNQLIATQAYEMIRSPFDGIITARNVDPGAMVAQATVSTTASGAPILLMATLDAAANLRRRAAERRALHQGWRPGYGDGRANIPDGHFAAPLRAIPTRSMPRTRTMRVEVDLDNHDSALLPGMYAILTLSVSRRPAGVPMVPDDALIFHGGKVLVPVVRDGRMHLAQVTLGYDNGINVEITSGISDRRRRRRQRRAVSARGRDRSGGDAGHPARGSRRLAIERQAWSSGEGRRPLRENIF